MTWQRKLARGFSLIEMAIVLVVIGIILSGGLLAVAPVLQSSKVTETNSKMDRIEQALTLYVIRYGCLPCPADAALASGTTSAGWSHATGGYYSSSCNTPCATTTQGIVPWVTLGLAENDGKDGFGFRIDYAVAPPLVGANSMVRTPPSTYPLNASNPTNDPNLGLTVEMSATNSHSVTTAVAAYVLISHGSDNSLAWNSAGVRMADPNGADADQAQNSDTNSIFIQDQPTSRLGSTTYFDDIVRFRTAPFIIQLCGTNACGNPA